MRGRIIRGIAGFYYVQNTEPGQDHTIPDVYECKAKGIFRKDHTKPLPGDFVEMDILEEDEKLGHIREILPRTNALIRPAVANVDQALVIMAAASPDPNPDLLNRFLIMMERMQVPVVICYNKCDLVSEEQKEQLAHDHRLAGYRVIFTSAAEKIGLEELSEVIEGKTTTVAGPSGVGKSSLTNLLQDAVQMEIGSISTKLERGKHTTRHSELICVRENTFLVDTPGFSSIELYEMKKEELADYFPEFVKWEPECRFTGCAHIHEPGCGVKAALERGEIGKGRYENYVHLYEELKNRRQY